MSAELRLATETDLRRAAVIERWASSHSTVQTRRTMESALRAVVRCAKDLEPHAPVNVYTFPWEGLADLVFYEWVQDRVRDKVERATARKYMTAVRTLLTALARTELAPAEGVRRTLQSACKLSSDPSPGRPLFPSNDLHRLLQVCRSDSNRPLGSRDLAMIATAAGTGARRAEVVALGVTSIRRSEGTIMFDKTKGGGFREAALHRHVLGHLDDWLGVRGHTSGPLFPALRRGGHLQDTPVSAHQFWKVLRQRAHEAGLDRAPTPHDLRRWFVSTLLTEGVDLFVVMRAVGHRSPTTTALYDRRPLEELRRFVDLLPIPDQASLDDNSPDADGAEQQAT
jgi:integrase/recombinase XerD